VLDTFQSLAVFALALLPGALYIWGFERVVGNWGISLSDRLVRFVGVSTILQVLWAPVTVYLWRELVVSGDAAEGVIPLWAWPIAIAYVTLPVMLGTAVGRGTRRRARWSRVFTGPSPAPRAWDHLFASRPDGWIRLRLKEGTWLGGAFSPPREASSSTMQVRSGWRAAVSSSGGMKCCTWSSSTHDEGHSMAKADRSKSPTIEKRGGYEPGPKKLSDFKPPPRTPGPGAKPASGDASKPDANSPEK
jgi:hypothetical protein